jgi:hypothetical protein
MHMTLTTTPIGMRRRRRSATGSVDCDVDTIVGNNGGRCCRYSRVVDFVEIGWNFIIAPTKWDAKLCQVQLEYMCATIRDSM